MTTAACKLPVIKIPKQTQHHQETSHHRALPTQNSTPENTFGVRSEPITQQSLQWEQVGQQFKKQFDLSWAETLLQPSK